jgi:hypothetical protein
MFLIARLVSNNQAAYTAQNPEMDPKIWHALRVPCHPMCKHCGSVLSEILTDMTGVAASTFAPR